MMSVLNLRDNEFVAILGPSGSGKTTLLNIIGGLDKYDKGDLIINGISTKKYKDRDWDSYRNHTCGGLCVARVKKLPIMLEFTSFQDTIMFHKRGRFGLEKVQNSEIHVKVVLDMECGNI